MRMLKTIGVAYLYIVLVSASLALIPGCTSPPVTPKTPAQTVYMIQGDYAAALAVAVQYKRLPECTLSQPSGTLCSRPQTVKQLQDADDLAFSTLQAAQGFVRMKPTDTSADKTTQAISIAQSAVAALVALTNTLTVK